MGAVHFSIDEEFVKFLVRELPLQLFVETGTFRGDTLELARKYFGECQSAELSPQLFADAQKRFANIAGVEIVCGPSPKFLRERRERHQQTPALFWLDAHWCVADHTGGEDSQSPLLGELDAITSLHPDSVLMIDDARLYLCAPPKPHRLGDWPDLHAIVEALLRLSRVHRLMVCNDVIVFYPARLQAKISEFVQGRGVDWLAISRAAQKHEKSKRRKFWPWG